MVGIRVFFLKGDLPGEESGNWLHQRIVGADNFDAQPAEGQVSSLSLLRKGRGLEVENFGRREIPQPGIS